MCIMLKIPSALSVPNAIFGARKQRVNTIMNLFGFFPLKSVWIGLIKFIAFISFK